MGYLRHPLQDERADETTAVVVRSALATVNQTLNLLIELYI